MVPPLEQEIRELRSAFWSDRDPDGRAFAPLADAYRREGELDQALELLEEGLERHPGFTSGHVVAGWVHRDRGDAAAAEAAFRTALDLDAENAEALRGLGELAAAGGREEEALEWLRILSDLEPGDASLRGRIEEIAWARDTVASEGGSVAEPPEAAAPDVAAVAAPPPGDALTEGIAALPLDQPEEPEETADFDLAALEAALATEDEAAWTPSPGPEAEDETDWAPPVEPEAGDETDGAPPAEPEPVGEAVVVTTDDVLETGDVVQDAGETGEVSELDVRVGGPEEGESEASADELPESDEEEAGHGLYTRTMAELYARQGLEARALDVYEQLLAAAPGDEELRARVEALRERVEVERSQAPPAEAAPAPAVAPPAPDPDAERRAEEEMEILAQDWARPAEQPGELSSPFAWASDEADPEEEAEAQGPPVRDYFRRMLSWAPGQAASGPAEAAEATGEVMAPEPEAAERAGAVAELAPEAAERTVDAAELAPEAEAAERTVDVAELAPEAEPAERTVDIAELAPDAEAEAAERTVDIAELAPDAGAEGGDGPRDEGEGRDEGGDAFSRWLNQLR